MVLFVIFTIVETGTSQQLDCSRLILSGTYTLDNGASGDLSEPMPIDIMQNASEVVLDGTLSSELAGGDTVTMRTAGVSFCIYRSDQLLFSYEADENARLLEPFGGGWIEFTAPSITPADHLTIRFDSLPGRRDAVDACNTLLNDSWVGTHSGLLHRKLLSNAGELIIGLLLIVMGAALSLSVLVLRRMKVNVPTSYGACGLLLISGALCSLIDFDFITLLFPNIALVNAFDCIFQALVVIFSVIYLRSFLRSSRSRKGVTLLIDALVVMFAVGCIGQITNHFFLYSMLNFLTFWSALTWGFLVVCIAFEFRKSQDKRIRTLMWAGLVLGVCIIVEVVHYLITSTYWIFVFQLGLLVFAVLQYDIMLKDVKEYYDKARRMEEAERELAQNRISIMLSQIQPHFLYNALVVIKQLCDIDAHEAKEAVVEFANYLRGNLDSLTLEECIPFNKELDHVRNYIGLEQRRFGSRVQIIYNISFKDFLIPALTLQPIVENAVRYGITRREEGGIVTISSHRSKDFAVVIIADDGIGYDPSKPQYDGRTHVGLENVRQRLAAMCAGSMDILSEEGVGTTVTLRIPLSPDAVDAAMEEIPDQLAGTRHEEEAPDEHHRSR